MRAAESCFTFIAFMTGIAASLGAVLTDPDMVYWFNWANAEGETGNVKLSLYAGFQVFCSNVEILGNSVKLCQRWETYDPDGWLCDGSAPPPPSPPPVCADQPNPATYTRYDTGQVVPYCSYMRQCCPGGPRDGPHLNDPGITISCGTVGWYATYCPVTCEAGCGRTHTPTDYNDVMCANMDMSALNTILWYVGIGFMLVKYLIERCFITTIERRRPKAVADSVLSLLSAVLLLVVLVIYASSCYPGEAFEDVFLSGSSTSQAQVELIDDIVTPSFGLGFFLGCVAAGAMLGAFGLSVALAYLSIRHGERESDVYV